MKLVSVSWVDSSSHSGWYSADQIDELSIHKEMISIGFLVREDDEIVAVASNKGKYHYGNITVIPRVAVTSITELAMPT